MFKLMNTNYIVGLVASFFLFSFLTNFGYGIIPNTTSEQNLTKPLSIVGTISSYPDPHQATGSEQTYILLPLKNQNTLYEGTFTFTSSKPLHVQSIHILGVNQSLKIPLQFGTLYTFPMNNLSVTTANLFDIPKTMGTITFTGNGLRLIANESFLVTYSLNGKELHSKVINNLTSGSNLFRDLSDSKI